MKQHRSIALALALMSAAAVSRAAPGEPPIAAGLFAAGQGETRGVLILDDGHVVARRFASGYGPDTAMLGWSMAKTVTGLLVGALVADGRLRLDAPAPVAEWHRDPADPRAAITLRQLMTMSSGLRHVEGGEPVDRSDTVQALFGRDTRGMAAAAFGAPLAYRPGTHWEYSSLTSVMLSEIVTRTLTPSRDPAIRAEAYRRFAQARLFGPAGISGAVLEFDAAGTQVGGSLIYMPLDDWGRLGMVLLDGMAPDGRGRIVEPDWLRFMKAEGGGNPEYGAQLWRNGHTPAGAARFPGAPADTIAAEGFQGQFVVASAASAHRRGVVVVRLGMSTQGQALAIRRAIGRLLAHDLPRARTTSRN